MVSVDVCAAGHDTDSEVGLSRTAFTSDVRQISVDISKTSSNDRITVSRYISWSAGTQDGPGER